MTEKLHEKVEVGREQLDSHEAEERHKLEHLKETAESQEHDHNLTKIHESIHKEAVSAKEVPVGELQEDNNQRGVFGVQRELKDDAYRRTIRKVRSRLNPAERVFSKLIHDRVLEPVSEVSSKTIARPSAILGGGIAALVGSGIVLYMAKHYGFEYNFTTFLVLLAGGFVFGLVIEGLVRLARHR